MFTFHRIVHCALSRTSFTFINKFNINIFSLYKTKTLSPPPICRVLSFSLRHRNCNMEKVTDPSEPSENCNSNAMEEHHNVFVNEKAETMKECIETIVVDHDGKCEKAGPDQHPHSKPSKRALKRQARAKQYKEMKKRKKAQNLIQTGREEAGYNLEEFDQTSYYFENGVRKVYPYPFVFATHAKGRWVGKTLRHVLEKEFGFDQPSDVDKAFNEGKIHVNGVQATVEYIVKDCDYISHQIHRHENPVTDSRIDILADTDEVVVINKPSSIPCHPCGRYRFNSVVFILGKEMGYSNLRNIYRLDRLTSGVLVLGKTAESTKRLEDQVLNREVQKEYVCRVEGEFPEETITVDQPLEPLSNKLRLQVIARTGKSSQTTFTRLSYNGQSSVVKCVPHTGRTHQIRVHLQYLGHPIINDVFYGSDAWGPNKGKGGIYEVAHDVVCSRIMKTHQATQWEGGENPLFHKKLEEMKLQKQGERPKSDGDSVNSTEDQLIVHSNKCKIAMSENDTINSSEKGSNDCDSITSSRKSKELSSEKKMSTLDTPVSMNADSLATLSQPRPGFDWTKWQVDSSCDMCRKTIHDPRPRDLVMFLHAWKYKGPGWKYQTELPDWAQDDWTNEKEFILESTMQRDAT